MTVTFPLQGDVDCNDPPPVVTWTPHIFDRFRVFVAWTPFFSTKAKITSGDTLLKTTSWTIPLKKWNKVCANANPTLYFRVYGKKAGTTLASTSEISAVIVK
jgi:hypothetical protein